MHQLSTFQIIVLGIFSVLILLGVGVFAAFGGLGSGNAVGPVTIWGTVDGGVMQQMINTMRQSDRTFEEVTYVEKSPINYEAELINAMAAGQGPDLLLLEQSSLQVFSDKIITIPYSEISQGTFINSYIDEGQLFLTSQGILALPFSIDPLVMYWNRDLFSSAGFAGAPQYWNDFLTFAPKVSSLSGLTPIKKSAVALGQWENIPNAKEILSTLFLQSGDRIVVRLPAQAGGTEGALQVVLGTRPEGATTDPASSALRFYTEFANPNKTTYSWNRSLPSSPQMFAAGDLAVYFGFASEYASFGMRNPNLRYAVAPMPQIEGSSSRITYGRMVGLAIPRTSSNAPGALEVAEQLTNRSGIGLYSQATRLPPVRRDVVLNTTDDAALAVFVESSLIARGWLDPAPRETDRVFQDMVESVVSGQNEPAGAVFDASQELQTLVK